MSKVAKIRRPGRHMLDMSIEYLKRNFICPPEKNPVKECKGEPRIGDHGDCHECWTEHLKWEDVHQERPEK